MRYSSDNDSNIQIALLWIRDSEIPTTLDTLLRCFVECEIKTSNQARQPHKHLGYRQATKFNQFQLRPGFGMRYTFTYFKPRQLRLPLEKLTKYLSSRSPFSVGFNHRSGLNASGSGNTVGCRSIRWLLIEIVVCMIVLGVSRKH